MKIKDLLCTCSESCLAGIKIALDFDQCDCIEKSINVRKPGPFLSSSITGRSKYEPRVMSSY